MRCGFIDCRQPRSRNQTLQDHFQAQNTVQTSTSKAASNACKSRKSQRLHCAAATQQFGDVDISQRVKRLEGWLQSAHGIDRSRARLDLSAGLYSTQEEFRASTAIQQGEAVLELPAELGITAGDARSDPQLADLTEGRSELVCLALWLLAERAKGSASQWHAFLESLPVRTETPILWSRAERQQLLQGSPVLEEAASRAAAIDTEWESISQICSASPSQYPQTTFNAEGFKSAMSVVLAHAAYLPTAQCFALLPLATLMQRTGKDDAAQLDFDLDKQTATVTAARSYRQGEAVALFDGRPNGELLLATGTLEDANPADCLTVRYSLVKADRLFSSKQMILESLGFSIEEEFPIFADRMPLQLLAYLRLARLQDPAQLALISFERDTVISQNNEYEILQLLMSDCRERLTNYPSTMEELTKSLQRKDLGVRERLATRLILSEQRILQGTVDAVRRRLAPIRGIPTKGGGMTDPNEDLKEIFDALEGIPKAPAKLLGGLMSWARGEQDPTWKKGKKQPPRRR